MSKILIFLDWILGLGHLILHKLYDFFGGLDTIHNWHLNIHQNKLINPIFTPTNLFEISLVHFDSLLSVAGRINLDIEFLLHHIFNNLNIKFLIIYYEDFFFAVTTLLPRNAF